MKQTGDNLHDGFSITVIMLTIDPTSVLRKQRVAANAIRTAAQSAQ